MLVNRPSQAELDAERVAVQAATLVPWWHVRQQVSRLKRELLIDFQGCSSWYPKVLVGLEAKTPDRVVEAVSDGRLGVPITLGPIHWLQEEVAEIQIFERRWVDAILGENDLQLVTTLKDQRHPSLRAHAEPINSCRRWPRAVRLDSDSEAHIMESVHKIVIHLEKGLSSCTDNERTGTAMPIGPLLVDCCGEFLGAVEPTATGAVNPNEIRVAEATCRRGAITLQACPEIAASEAAEDRRPACVGAFTLKGVEDLLYNVRHDRALASNW